MKRIKVTNSRDAIVDNCDYLKLNQINWVKNTDRNGLSYPKANGKHNYIKMHHFILPKKQGYQIDHINRDPFDNRRNNLRYVTKSQQMLNRSKFKSKSSIYRGVSYRKDNKKWSAYICVTKKNYHLGYFKTELEAAKAYDAEAKKYNIGHILNFEE